MRGITTMISLISPIVHHKKTKNVSFHTILCAQPVRGTGEAAVTVNGGDITLDADDNDYALADFGTRPARMTLECDVSLDLIGCAGFVFEPGVTHHVKLVCENEIVIMYMDGVKALSSRISHSVGGAHIGVFANSCHAQFSNVTVKIPE